MKNTGLWNRNFTIITLGTVVSMLGNAISGFAIGLLVLDYTDSIFLYTLFMVAYSLPKIVMPMIAGPYLDNFSRRRVIYTLDFISAALYAGMCALLIFGFFSYVVFLPLAMLIGAIDSVYSVAYDSLYPMLVDKEHYRKAYSVSSMLYPISAMMVPAAAYVYEAVGLAPLFLFNAFTFLVAAVFETQIRVSESQIKEARKALTLKSFADDFKAGLDYIKGEKGLFVITAYFTVNTLLASSYTLFLPYFKTTEGLSVVLFTYVMGCEIVGRLVGGLLHYKFKYPARLKLRIAVSVYVISSVLEGTLLFVNPIIMMFMTFVAGLLMTTSFNIRISSTQNYVPNEFRGRFNGSFQMLCTLGGIVGQLAAGTAGEFITARTVISVSMALNLFAVFFIMFMGRKHVAEIYNTEL